MSKKLIAVFLVLSLVLSISSFSIFAYDHNTNEQQKLPPKEIYDSDIGKPIGDLTDNPLFFKRSTGVPPTFKIKRTYKGYDWRGWKAQGGKGGSVSLSKSFGISNGFNSSISVSAYDISAAVGFNVSYSTSETATYSHDISDGKYGHIGLDDRFNVKEFDVTTYVSSHGQLIKKEGSGWAKQWYKYAYYYGETDSKYKEPPNPHN